MKALAYTCFTFAGVFLASVIWGIVATGEFENRTGSVLLVLVPLAFGTGFMALAPRFASRFDTPVRVTAFTLGVIALLIGLAWIPYEETYGVGTNYMITEVGDTGSVYVIEEQTGRETLVFEGTVDEARRYVDEQGFETTDFTGPYVTIAAGALVTLAAMTLGWRRVGESEETTERV